ncbi:MAG: hypothetical protein ACPGKS_03695 [Coraliomargarita sp.]
MADSGANVGLRPSRSQRLLSPVLWLALMLGVAVHLAGFLIFRVVSNPLPDREPEGAFLKFLSAGSMASDADLEEQAILFDSAPLFIPTKWNTSSRIFAGVEGSDWQFPDFEPAIDLNADLEPSARILAEGVRVTEPMDLLALRYWKFFDEFTSAAHVEEPLSATASFAEVYLVDQGGVRWGGMPVPLEYSGVTAREPVDYYLRIDGSGQRRGGLRLAASSGSDGFDEAARQWLESPPVQYRMPAGYLLVRIFP